MRLWLNEYLPYRSIWKINFKYRQQWRHPNTKGSSSLDDCGEGIRFAWCIQFPTRCVTQRNKRHALVADGSGEKALIGGKGVGYEKRGEKSRKEEAGETETVRPKCDQRPIWSGTRASLLREQPDREATRNARRGHRCDGERAKTHWKEMQKQRDDNREREMLHRKKIDIFTHR